MKNLYKKSLYTIIGLFLSSISTLTSFAATDTTTTTSSTSGFGNIIKNSSSDTSRFENGTGGGFIETVENIIAYAVGLLYFVAICYALYGGFQILTAGGDDGKVKKGKTTLINAAMGLAAIFLASTIINWVIDIFSSGDVIVTS